MIVVIGDLHYSNNEPVLKARRLFFEWFSEQDFNSEENTLIFLGDVVDSPKVEGHVIKEIQDAFVKLKFKRKIFLNGNHDWRYSQGNFLVAFTNLGIEVIDYIKEDTIEDSNILFMPHYIADIGQKPMSVLYKDITQDGFKTEYDYIFGHYSDETQMFFKGIDTSYLNGNKIFGHIHKGSKNYLGTPIITRLDEANKKSQIALIDQKKVTHLPVPKFIDYYSVKYEDYANTVFDSDIALIKFTEAPSIKSVKEAIRKDHYIHSILLSSATDTMKEVSEDMLGMHDLKELFERFCNEKNLSKNIQNKMKEVIKLNEEDV